MRHTGILADYDIEKLMTAQNIYSKDTIEKKQIQPASLDLRLGAKAYRVCASFLPGPQSTVLQKLSAFSLYEIDLEEGAILEPGAVYIVPLLEYLQLPDNICAHGNPKSSTGRLDIFTRLVCDYSHRFDAIACGYEGPLYLEISPKSFPICVRKYSSLSQIRFAIGDTKIKEAELSLLHQEYKLTNNENFLQNGAVSLSIDLNGAGTDIIGYRAKKYRFAIDVDVVAQASIADYWEPIYGNASNGLVLDPGEFYIFSSCETVYIPPCCAAEMVPFDPAIGEFRVHYAGFFDPGFGQRTSEEEGSRVVLEVRSRDVPFIVEHGQIVGHLLYEHMLREPKILYGAQKGSHYQMQGLKLSKHFRMED